MRKMFNDKKTDNNALSKGFTLAELLVVIAIIGVLAAVLVPSMISYVSQARLDTANSSAKTVYNALNSYCQQCINGGIKLPAGQYHNGSGGFMAPVKNAPDDGNLTPKIPEDDASLTQSTVASLVEDAMAMNLGIEFVGTVYAFSINDYGYPNGLIWAETTSTPYVGGYPNIAENTNWTLNDATKT